MQQVSWVSPLGSGVRSQSVRLVWAGDSRPSRMQLEESCVLRSLEDACWGLQNVSFAQGRGCPESVEAWDLKRGNGFAWHCGILWQWFPEHYLCGGRGRDATEPKTQGILSAVATGLFGRLQA